MHPSPAELRSLAALRDLALRKGFILEPSTTALPDDVPVPDVALRLRCSACGSKEIKTVPRWV